MSLIPIVMIEEFLMVGSFTGAFYFLFVLGLGFVLLIFVLLFKARKSSRT